MRIWKVVALWALFLLVACLLLQTSCATIFQGRTQTIKVTSDPSKAKVFVDGKQMSATPVEIVVKRKRIVTIRLEKEGYDPYEMSMKRRLCGWPFADLFMSSTMAMYRDARGLELLWIYALPLGIDFLTGSAFTLLPSQIEVRLSGLKDKQAAQ